MIAHLRGKLLSKRNNQAIVEAGGVGYDVAISIPTYTGLPEAGAEVALHVHTHVREDSLALYGFLRSQEKELFERLISVSGIGPKLALVILSGMVTEKLVAAIGSNDVLALTKVPGIGKKTAERMVLELRDKLASFGAVPAVAGTAGSPLEEDVLSALTNLGYSRVAAEKALTAAKNGGSQGFDNLFRNSLGMLSK